MEITRALLISTSFESDLPGIQNDLPSLRGEEESVSEDSLQPSPFRTTLWIAGEKTSTGFFKNLIGSLHNGFIKIKNRKRKTFS